MIGSSRIDTAASLDAIRWPIINLERPSEYDCSDKLTKIVYLPKLKRAIHNINVRCSSTIAVGHFASDLPRERFCLQGAALTNRLPLNPQVEQ